VKTRERGLSNRHLIGFEKSEKIGPHAASILAGVIDEETR
jgi:hypothetical protein